MTSPTPGLRHGSVVVDGHRLHHVECGQGRPLLLVPGWPQSWYAWRLVMPLLAAAGRRVVAVDPRGMGDSAHPAGPYDVGTVATELRAFAAALGLDADGPFDIAGHDVGAWIAYAFAADHPPVVRRVALMEALLPGLAQPAAGIPSEAANLRTWHFAFNRLPDLPELLVQGHERAYLAWLFAQKSARGWAFTPEVLDEYVRVFAQPGGARAAFAYYRDAFSEPALQRNRERAATPLSMPVLAVGGEHGVGDALHALMKPLARELRGACLAGVGHYVMEEAPDEVAALLVGFFDSD
ncbi:alpha/beta fold hydrolase [Sorangium sp. So ce834]|uniref:alpha/beta fold hydrolase n=1 Tax=Sorangium sp. So ce834 TaxID=3133321 RepID=UPI003F605424